MDNLINLLRDPPGWILAIVGGWLVIHALRFILEHAHKVSSLDATIAAVEIVVTVGITFAVLHQYYEMTLRKVASVRPLDDPGNLLIVLVVFAVMSISLIILHKRRST